MFYRRFILLLACLGWFLTGASAQNCGSRDTVLLEIGGTTNYTLIIDDLVNNDLSDPTQGVCGIELNFAHQYVYDLEINLTSPNGDVVNLIGPDNNQNRPPSIFTRWFIDFTTCANSANPDPGASPVWDNNHPFNWSSGSVYQGTYHPNSGCLEDFNSGPANGNWTISVTSNRPLARGGIFFFRLQFCDDRGIDCCFANAGELVTTPTELCTGHPDLDFDLPPVYSMPRPDDTEYSYTYLVGREGIFYGINDDADLTTAPPGNYTICGFSYRTSELSNLPAPDGIITVADIRADLATFTPALCGELSTSCQSVNILPPPDTTFLQRTVCTGVAVPVGDTTYAAAGTYTRVLTGVGQCDSIVVLDLETVNVVRNFIEATVCFGSSVTVGSTVFSTTTLDSVTLTAQGGCDSIVTIDLTVLDRIALDTAVAICAGDSFQVGNEMLTTAGVYDRTLTSITLNCDSFVRVDLAVLEPEIFVTGLPIINCNFLTANLNANPSMTQFARDFQWLNLDEVVVSNTALLSTDTSGFFIIELTETHLGVSCTIRDTIEVEDLRMATASTIVLPDTLTCGRTLVSLDGAGSSTGVQYRYEWIGPPGADFALPVDQISTSTRTPGDYELIVSNVTTGCEDTARVTVQVDREAPSAAMTGIDLLTCDLTQLTLSADTQQVRSDELRYVWSADCLPNPIINDQLPINCPGEVRLLVRNLTNNCTTLNREVIDQDIAKPTVVIDPPATLTCRDPEIILDGSASAPSGLITYSWRDETAAEISNLATSEVQTSQNYQLVVRNQDNGCLDTASVFVPVNQIFPNADAGPDTTAFTCFDPTLNLGGSGTSLGINFSYGWTLFGAPFDTLGFNRTLFVEPPGGQYIFSVLDEENGCLTMDTTRVLIRQDTPFVRIDPPIEFGCFAESVELDASATFLAYDNELSWTGDCLPAFTDTAIISVNCPGVYEFTVTNLENGCVGFGEVTVELEENAVRAILPDSAFIDCASGFTFIDRSLSTPAARTTWLRDGVEVGLIGLNPLVTVPGTYTLILENFDASCQDTATIEVVAPCSLLAIVIPPDSLTCDRTQVLLDAGPTIPGADPGFSFEWLVDNPACVVPGANDRQLLAACPGEYGYVVRNDVLGTSDTSYVTVSQNLIRPMVEAGPNDTLTCNDPVVQLDAALSEQNPDFAYLWTDDGGDTLSTTQLAGATQPGIYFLRVTNTITGCNRTDGTTVFRDNRIPDLTLSERFIPCREDSFELTVITDPVDGNYAFGWNGPTIQANGDSATAIIGSAGIYTATVTNLDNGCPTTASVETLQLPCPPCLLLTDTVLTCQTNPLVINLDFCEPCQGCSFSWFRNGVEIPGQVSTSLPVTRAGNYRVESVNQFGLRSAATSVVRDLRVLPVQPAGPDRMLTCDSSSIVLGSVVVDTVYGFEYTWLDALGSPIPPADTTFLRVDQPGFYVLESFNPVSFCTGLDTVLVGVDTLAPRAQAGNDIELTCEDRVGVLLAGNSSQGSIFRFQWSSDAPDLCLEGENTLNPLVACGGEYVLSVRNRINGCISRDTVIVTASDDLPAIIPLPDTVLSCSEDTVWLRPQLLEPGLRTEWCLENEFGDLVPGSCVIGNDYPADAAGNYRFVVTNDQTGCFNDFSVTVGTDFRPPLANAGRSDTLYCTLDSLALIGSGVSATGANNDFVWSSLTGFPLSNSNQDTAYAFQPDRYVLTVTDQQNGCFAMDTVELFRDVAAPIANAGLDTTLNCRRLQLRLSASAQTLSGQAQLNWTTLDGNLINGISTLNPLIDEPGEYLFAVFDPVNSCTTQDIVRVEEDVLPPSASLANVDSLLVNCYQPELILDGSSSTPALGNELAFAWRTLGIGTNLNNVTNDSARVTNLGSYQLIVTNSINRCEDTLRISVAENFLPPSVILTPPALLTCDTLTATVTAFASVLTAPYEYSWMNADSPGDTLSREAEITVSEPGSYLLGLLDTINGCVSNREVTVNANRALPEVVLNDPLALGCDRTLAPINGTGSSQGNEFDLTWSTNNGNFVTTANPYQIRATEPGLYYFSVENTINGCLTIDSAEVDRLALSITGLDLDIIQPACDRDLTGGLMVLGINGGLPPYRFRLDGGVLSDRIAFNDLPIGSHTITVVDTIGCDYEQTFTLLPGEEVLLSLGQDTTIRLGDSIALDFTTNLSSWDTLIWESLGPITQAGANPLVVSPEREYAYELTIVDENGCTGYDFIRIGVLNDIQLYVPNIFTPNGDNNNDLFFPNAGPQVTNIALFQVFDRWGNLVHKAENFSPNDPAFGWDGNFGGNPLNSNVFVWQLELELADGETIYRYGDVVLRR